SHENPYVPVSSSGTSHQAVAAAEAADHQASSRIRNDPRGRVRTYRNGTTRTATVAVALMPPQQAIASPDRAAARTRPVSPDAAAASGRTIHGSIATGMYSDEICPSVASPFGASA